MRASICALALCTALILPGLAQAPVGPVPPKPANPPTIDALQKLIEAARAPATDKAWSAMAAEDQQRVYDELTSLMEQLKKGMGLPVGPVAPVTAPPPDPKKPAPPSKKELDAVLTELSGVLDAGRKKSPAFAPVEAVRLQQLLSGLQKQPS
jgi:hypothetical protein